MATFTDILRNGTAFEYVDYLASRPIHEEYEKQIEGSKYLRERSMDIVDGKPIKEDLHLNNAGDVAQTQPRTKDIMKTTIAGKSKPIPREVKSTKVSLLKINIRKPGKVHPIFSTDVQPKKTLDELKSIADMFCVGIQPRICWDQVNVKFTEVQDDVTQTQPRTKDIMKTTVVGKSKPIPREVKSTKVSLLKIKIRKPGKVHPIFSTDVQPKKTPDELDSIADMFCVGIQPGIYCYQVNVKFTEDSVPNKKGKGTSRIARLFGRFFQMGN